MQAATRATARDCPYPSPIRNSMYLVGQPQGPTQSPIRNGMHHVGPEAVAPCWASAIPHPQRFAPCWTEGRRGKGMGVGGVGALRLPCCRIHPIGGRRFWGKAILGQAINRAGRDKSGPYGSHSERHAKSSCPSGSTCAIPPPPLPPHSRPPRPPPPPPVPPISYPPPFPTSVGTRFIASASAPILSHPDTSITPPTSLGNSISRVRRRLAFLIVRFNI